MKQKTAAFLIIGNEILSGRTQDANLNYLATKLTDKGIALSEARIVPDVEAEIISAVTALSDKYDYCFTSGGIGPTHDDITMASIAKAFNVPVIQDADAYQMLVEYYGGEDQLTSARARMALVPEGSTLIENVVSGAPGARFKNVFIMAGVPKIMHAMLDTILETLGDGPKTISETIVFERPESQLAEPLGEIAKAHPDVDIGSYPQYREGKYVVSIVVRGLDKEKLNAAVNEIRKIS